MIWRCSMDNREVVLRLDEIIMMECETQVTTWWVVTLRPGARLGLPDKEGSALRDAWLKWRDQCA